MTDNQRLIPEWPFPPYRFIPGVNPHPKKSQGHMEGQSDPVAIPLDLNSPQKSDFLLYSLDLYNAEYFWESHVYLEALWNAHKRKGLVADFLKGMIKLCAAGLTIQVGQKKSCIGHLERAKELFLTIEREEGSLYLGFSLSDIVKKIDFCLQSDLKLFQIRPTWKDHR